MRLKMVVLLASLALLTSSCAMYIPPPSVDVTSNSGSDIHLQVNPNFQNWDIHLGGIDTETRNEFGAWVKTGSYIRIPCHWGGQPIKIIPHGRCISGEAWWDWEVPNLRQHWDLGPYNWEFGIPNYHDSGAHSLVIEVRVWNPGQRPYVMRNSYTVFCPHRCER